MIEKRCIQPVTLADFKIIYDEHMTQAFDAAELKPFWRIRDMVEKGVYEIYAYVNLTSETPELLGYACFYCPGDILLLDYFAMVSGARGKGNGSTFLRTLMHDRNSHESIFIELEAPEKADRIEQVQKRERRIQFYRRLGFTDTGVRMTVFQVPYHLYAYRYGKGQKCAEEDFSSLYEGMLSPDTAHTHVRIRQ